MWSSTVGLVNGKHRYLTAETFGFKVNSNGQQLKRRQQWTIEPFPENTGPDGSISSAASVTSSQCPAIAQLDGVGVQPMAQLAEDLTAPNNASTCIMTLPSGVHLAGLSLRQSATTNGSNSGSDHSQGCDEEHENVAIKSHLNKYLAVDSFGNVTCDSDEKTENARFTITICSMSQGKSKDEHIFWAFKNVERGYYLGTTEDGMICCNAKMPKSRAELWHLHLLPARGASFFALKSLGRKRFARVCADEQLADSAHQASNGRQQQQHTASCNAQVQLDANLSWGPETLFQFKYYDGGRYALLTSGNKCLTNEGKCVAAQAMAIVGSNSTSLPPNECLFTLEYHSGYLAFRDSFGHYLAAAGRSSVLRSRSIGVSRDELFMFEGVPIQVSMKATFNNRWVSIKQGVDVSANQMETTSEFETFQLTYHKQTQLWSIMSKDCNFWTVSKNTNTVCVCRPADYEAHTRGQFKLIWSDNDASFSLKFVGQPALGISSGGSQERWILARKSGQLYASCADQEAAVRFIMRFQNRRLLNLRPIEGSGFVGLKSLAGALGSKQLEANKTAPDSIQVEYSELPACLSAGMVANGVANHSQQLHSASAESNGSDTSSVIEDSNSGKVISMFNVKLNSTRKGQNVLLAGNLPQQQQHHLDLANTTAKFNQPNQQNQHEQEQIEQANDGPNLDQKQLNCQTIDSNNNEPELGGSCVESASAPSVASIINTFSNVRVSEQQHAGQQASRPMGSLAVSKLASSFEPAKEQLSNQSEHQSNEQGSQTSSAHLAADVAKLNTDQVAQSECCYLRTVTNGKYLLVGSVAGLATAAASTDANSGAALSASNGNGAQEAAPSSHNPSVLCDATNKACAQSWILELRSHNSIAIRASDTQAYMQLGTNGTIYLSRCEPKEASLWEF